MKMNLKKGFTLIELLVVVVIIGILASVVLALLNTARAKGADAAIKANLSNAVKQAEVFYNVNSVVTNTYTNVCTNAGAIGGALPVGPQLDAAAKAAGLSGYVQDAIGTATTATCNDATGAGWAAEVPLKTTIPAANQMWCVDSTGKSAQKTGTSLASTTDITCN
jgi:prepilin-type N-terminal cleavage/methylation domain-containing protein